MTNSNDNDDKQRSRRTLLKATGVAGVAASAIVLPNSWTKPILRAVVVPAHAQTTTTAAVTTGTGTGTGTTTTTTTTTNTTTNTTTPTTITTTTVTSTTTTPASSDRRLKRNIRAVATLDSGLTLYAFKYLWSDTEFVGVMAQDLLGDDAFKYAAVMTETGFYVVDYAMLGLRMATYEEWREIGLDSVKLYSRIGANFGSSERTLPLA